MTHLPVMVVPHSTGQLVRSLVRIPGSGANREANPTCLDLSNVSSLAATVPVSRTLPSALLSPQPPPVNPFELGMKPRSMTIPAKTAPRPATGRKRSAPQELLEDSRETALSTSPAPKAPRIATAPAAQSLQIQISLTQGSTPNQAPQVIVLPTLMQPQQLPNLTPTAAVQQYQLPIMGAGIVQMENPQNPTNTRMTGLPEEVPEHGAQNGSTGYNVASSTNDVTQVAQLCQEMNQLREQNKALIERVTKFQNLFKDRKCLQLIANRFLGAPMPA